MRCQLSNSHTFLDEALANPMLWYKGIRVTVPNHWPFLWKIFANPRSWYQEMRLPVSTTPSLFYVWLWLIPGHCIKKLYCQFPNCRPFQGEALVNPRLWYQELRLPVAEFPAFSMWGPWLVPSHGIRKWNCHLPNSCPFLCESLVNPMSWYQLPIAEFPAFPMWDLV